MNMCDFWNLFASIMSTLALFVGVTWFLYVKFIKRDIKKNTDEINTKILKEATELNALTFFNFAIISRETKNFNHALDAIEKARNLYVKLNDITKIDECEKIKISIMVKIKQTN